VGYRDETEGLRQRVEVLEEELGQARATIARLTGESVKVAIDSDKPNWFVGAPVRLELERELPFEVSDEGYEAIAELLRQRYPGAIGGVAQVGRTLTFRAGGVIELKLTRLGKGRMRLGMRGDHRAHGVLLGAFTPGASIVGLGGAVALLKAAGATPASLIVVVPLVVLSCFFAIRALLARSVHKQRSDMAGLFESVAELAANHAVAPGARIAESDEAAGAQETSDAARAELAVDEAAAAEADEAARIAGA
jgi:hypothetical protein